MNVSDHILVFGALGKRVVIEAVNERSAQVYVLGLGASGAGGSSDPEVLRAAWERYGGLVVSLSAGKGGVQLRCEGYEVGGTQSPTHLALIKDDEAEFKELALWTTVPEGQRVILPVDLQEQASLVAFLEGVARMPPDSRDSLLGLLRASGVGGAPPPPVEEGWLEKLKRVVARILAHQRVLATAVVALALVVLGGLAWPHIAARLGGAGEAGEGAETPPPPVEAVELAEATHSLAQRTDIDEDWWGTFRSEHFAAGDCLSPSFGTPEARCEASGDTRFNVVELGLLKLAAAYASPDDARFQPSGDSALFTAPGLPEGVGEAELLAAARGEPSSARVPTEPLVRLIECLADKTPDGCEATQGAAARRAAGGVVQHISRDLFAKATEGADAEAPEGADAEAPEGADAKAPEDEAKSTRRRTLGKGAKGKKTSEPPDGDAEGGGAGADDAEEGAEGAGGGAQ